MKTAGKLLTLALTLVMPITLIGSKQSGCCGRRHGGYRGGGVGVSWNYGPMAYSNPWYSNPGYLSYGAPPFYGWGW